MPPKKVQRGAIARAERLTDQEREFVSNFVQNGGNWSEAARDARFHPDDGIRLMANPDVLALIEYERRRTEVATASAGWVKRRLLTVATADARELTEHWRVPCRYCWGKFNLYQWRDASEYEAARNEQAQRLEQLVAGVRRRFSSESPIDYDELVEALDYRFGLKDEGGYGYTINREPMRGSGYVDFMRRVGRQSGRPMVVAEANAPQDCPRCDGHGISYVIFHDTRNLSPAAALLFQGVKISAGGGIEYKIRDPATAERELERVLGMHLGLKPLETLDPTKMTRENIVAALADYALVYGPDDASDDIPYLPNPSA